MEILGETRQNAALLVFLANNIYDYDLFYQNLYDNFTNSNIKYKDLLLMFISSKLYYDKTYKIYIKSINKLLEILKSCKTLTEYDYQISYFKQNNSIIKEVFIKSNKPDELKYFAIYTFSYVNNYIFKYASEFRSLYK
jgi:hypothetical protein